MLPDTSERDQPVLVLWQNLTDDDCSEDKMNNLQFYLNKYPSAPDGNAFRLSEKIQSVLSQSVYFFYWHKLFLCHLAQTSTSNPFIRNGRMTTKDWSEFTRTFSGAYACAWIVCFRFLCSPRLENQCHLISVSPLHVACCEAWDVIASWAHFCEQMCASKVKKTAVASECLDQNESTIQKHTTKLLFYYYLLWEGVGGSNSLKILLWLLNMWYLLKYLIEVKVFCRVSWHHIGTVVSLDAEWILCWFSLGFSAIKRLFPLREPGVNYMASELTRKEIEVRVNQKTSV